MTGFLRYFASLHPGRWCLPLLYTLISNHRALSILADNVALSVPGQSSMANKRLEECARQLNKAFSACVADRTTEEEESRKWGTYRVVGMVFRGYFKVCALVVLLKTVAYPRLCSSSRSPCVATFSVPSPRLICLHWSAFLAQRGSHSSTTSACWPFWEKSMARQKRSYGTPLSIALGVPHIISSECRPVGVWHAFLTALPCGRMILQYLIPCRLLAGTLPSSVLLARFPSLAALYSPFITAIRRGDVQAYDAALATPMLEKALVKNGTYLAIERAREICLRGLLKLVYRCKDLQSRISIDDFHRALVFVGIKVDRLETEWLVATQIAKVSSAGRHADQHPLRRPYLQGYLRGYISHSHMMTVLSAQNPFPKLRTIAVV